MNPWRIVALPAEHGACALLLTALVIGVFVAPVPVSAVAAMAVLLACSAGNAGQVLTGPHPLPCRRPAWLWFGSAGTFALVVTVAVTTSVGWSWLAPSMAILPLLLLAGARRLALGPGRGRRDLLVQAAGLSALALTVVPVALAGGAGVGPAWALGGLLAGQSLVLAVAVRTRLRRRQRWLPPLAGVAVSGMAAVILAPWSGLGALGAGFWGLGQAAPARRLGLAAALISAAGAAIGAVACVIAT